MTIPHLSPRSSARLRVWLRLLAGCLIIAVFFQTSAPPPGDLYTGAAAHARDSLFDYLGWELDALANKAFQEVLGAQDYLDEAARSAVVRAYMADLTALYRLEAQIADLYTDPTVNHPEDTSVDLRAERDTLRRALLDRQGMVESILQGQVSAVLAGEGLAFLGQVLPPVAIRITPLPDVLILSPRDAIRVAASLTLDALPVDSRSALEAAIDADLDVSSLVVDIGGMALYPSMIGETDVLPWLVETTAHEWVHHYLLFYPLGLYYFDGGMPDTRIINETTADLLGKEIGRAVLRRYYPELAPPDPPENAVDEPAAPAPADPLAFDFAAEMNETRVTVDSLLAAGDVEAAEAYMAGRQAFFRENGYPIRKINQAYFAFYGGYQGEDNFGTAGEDPIGPAIAALRVRAGSAASFLAVIRNITTRQALLDALDELEQSG